MTSKPLPRGRVCDAPAGSGALSLELKDLGFDVVPVDIDETRWGAPALTCHKADLNRVLPFSDSSFDAVVCVEGIEHLENPHHVVREFSRLLKPGGTLVITTPNITNLKSRMKFFLFGSPCYFNSRIDIDDPSLKGHINPIGFPELEMVL